MNSTLKYILIVLAAGILLGTLGCSYFQKNHEFNEVKAQADKLNAQINIVEDKEVEALRGEINATKEKFSGIANSASEQIASIKLSRTTSQKGNANEDVDVYCRPGKIMQRAGLTFHWSAEAGEFNDPSAQSTVWHQPDETGKYAVTCEITSQNGAPIKLVSEPVRVTNYPILNPSPSPEFTSRRLTGDGEFNLSTYTPGKVVLLNWWATW